MMSSSINANGTYSQDIRTSTKALDKVDAPSSEQKAAELTNEQTTAKVQDPISVTNKQQLNAAIIESSLKFNTTIGDQPLSLLLKTALQGINEALKGTEVETSIEEVYESGVDFSPEATAERIVSFSTQFFGSYRDQHPEIAEDEALSAFVDIISGGIDQGFGEAKDILSGLKVLEGEIGDTIDKTYTLVQEGLQSFVESFDKKEEEPAQ
ncbi:DUF5610 domain-containing protein [Colwellia sp. MSW7]|uniref:DUF5610 domain-containing protein n=1 Tax=Colwellia maritima TaxID=2912588 RepID=A0ABS9WXR9_9GAMM|nr:DUF5610 domain-containing protein [Colwellia maritima]MCI2282798.1 DUF5610 domain-containing protein [Colwellia maritima]